MFEMHASRGRGRLALAALLAGGGLALAMVWAGPASGAPVRSRINAMMRGAVGNVPLNNPEGFFPVVDDQAKMIDAIWHDL